MEKGIKIVTIGGGSSYTPELVEGFIKRYDQLPVRELWLVDIEEGKEKLEIVGNLAKRMVKEANVPIEIHLTLDRREALVDADFVTTQFRVGLLQARALDERIPLKYGMIGQETNGAGGLFKGLRTIPVILDIIKDVEELCPNAWVINFANPAGMVTEAVLRYTNFDKFIGVCNVPVHTKMYLSQVLEVDNNRVDVDFIGLNHMVYATDVYVDKENVTKKILNLLLEQKESLTMKNIEALDWEPEFIKALGVLPCPYHRYYYKTKEVLEAELNDYKKGTTRAEEVMKLEKELFELYKDPNLRIKPPQLEKRGGAYYSDAACNVIQSIYNDTGDIQYLNVRNNGVIKEFDDNSAIEVSCMVTKDGAVPLDRIKGLPTPVKGLVQQIKSFEITACEAAVTGDYGKALLALCINPLVDSDVTAKKVLNEMLEAHKKYLPNFQRKDV